MHALGQLLDRDRGIAHIIILVARDGGVPPVVEAENEAGADKPAMLPRPAVGTSKIHLEPRLLGRLPSAVRVLDAISAVA